MRIAYITRAPFGAIGAAASYMFPKVMAEHCDVLVLSPRAELHAEEIVVENSGLDLCELTSESANGRCLELFRALDRFKPDIVHMFQGPDCLLYMDQLKNSLGEAKWILDFRSPLITNRERAKKRMLKRYFLCQFYADRILSHSNLTIRDNIGKRFRRVFEVPPGVDLKKFSGKTTGTKRIKRFVYVGSVSKVRNIEFLVKEFASFAAQVKEDVSLDIIGGGDALEGLLAKVSAQNWSSINLIGSLPQDQVFEKLGQYDLGIAYVPNGRYDRAPSLKSLELSAAGLPILASDTAGHRDYMDRFGFQFNLFKNQLGSLTENLRSISNADLEKQRMKNLEVVEGFDWQTIGLQRLLPLYRDLASKH
ncbi:hypothetical protein GCM10007924_09850 [Sneathiella chinensis]|uniref:Glycosyl transferase family 1 domain-containing protein n=1 Tax=Sneathiella chinensis TaxID=349750 RepID=A0ABQ5U0T0_9PROT|nr:hypothetical protein GCM10007924_09850 [Sneathiella chinensis]